MNHLINKALAAGFTRAVWLDGLRIECEARLREYCNPEGCPQHGSNWVCPPGCGSLDECAQKVRRFDKGILLQSVSEMNPLIKDLDRYKELNRIHNFRLRGFLEAHCNNDMDVLALTSGGCVFCEGCSFPAPCIKPGLRMNSLSAYGIDVGKLCEMAELEYSFRPDKVYYAALVLVNDWVYSFNTGPCPTRKVPL
ncbi:MAG: DUF2284 domain-containing protein [Defluviitaleaceae bacterium]|nr:DUF2284 domain-containing protein [Defluviitaleaceae bacterium]MCL2836227.1 DUF2284 domain-containing protein [Defluviitaleaceae bacterium]